MSQNLEASGQSWFCDVKSLQEPNPARGLFPKCGEDLPQCGSSEKLVDGLPRRTGSVWNKVVAINR